MSKHIVVFSHGFGVEKDDRGLLTDIAAELPEVESILFDYNRIDRAANTLTIAPLDDQARQLNEVLHETRANNPAATIDVIAHSQGCVVAALAHPAGIRRTIMLAGPAALSIDRMKTLFADRAGSSFDESGTSRLARKDGSTTIVPSAYWDSIRDIDPKRLYFNFSRETELHIVIADHDEIIGVMDFSSLGRHARLHHVGADHNFTGHARPELLALVGKLVRHAIYRQA